MEGQSRRPINRHLGSSLAAFGFTACFVKEEKAAAKASKPAVIMETFPGSEYQRYGMLGQVAEPKELTLQALNTRDGVLTDAVNSSTKARLAGYILRYPNHEVWERLVAKTILAPVGLGNLSLTWQPAAATCPRSARPTHSCRRTSSSHLAPTGRMSLSWGASWQLRLARTMTWGSLLVCR